MKKIILLALLTIGISATHAQTRYGITAGFGQASIHSSNAESNTQMNKRFKPAWQAGFLADIPLTNRLYLQPQLLINVKGNSKYLI